MHFALTLASALCLAVAAPLAEVRPAPHGKGKGAFAATDFRRGELVCAYEGERLTGLEVAARYGPGGGGDYLFEVAAPSAVSGGVYIDGAHSTHFSRFINHAEHGNLESHRVLKAQSYGPANADKQATSTKPWAAPGCECCCLGLVAPRPKAGSRRLLHFLAFFSHPLASFSQATPSAPGRR